MESPNINDLSTNRTITHKRNLKPSSNTGRTKTPKSRSEPSFDAMVKGTPEKARTKMAGMRLRKWMLPKGKAKERPVTERINIVKEKTEKGRRRNGS